MQRFRGVLELSVTVSQSEERRKIVPLKFGFICSFNMSRIRGKGSRLTY